MADNPTHMIVIESKDGDELRRMGPMNLGRAYQVKHRWENSPDKLGDPTNVVRIIDSPDWDFEHNKEKQRADTDEASRRDSGNRGRRDEGDAAEHQR